MRNSNRPAMTLGAIVIALSLGVTAVDAAEGKLDTELLRKAFDEADMNGDGRLGEGEFAADGVTAFVSVDKNGDEKLSRAELGAAGADSFSKLDANGDGKVRRRSSQSHNICSKALGSFAMAIETSTGMASR